MTRGRSGESGRWGWGLEATADNQRPVRCGGGGRGLKRQLMTRGRSGGRGGWGWGLEATADDQRAVRWGGGGGGLELEATADDQKQRCVLWGEVRQWELESARRKGVEVKGPPQQQSTACQNGRRTRAVGLEALSRC